jgi:hypothetical protein
MAMKAVRIRGSFMTWAGVRQSLAR